MATRGVRVIAAQELKRRVRSKSVFILDVREPWEFEEGHIRGSVNIPLGVLVAGVADFSIPKNKLIVAVCEHGRRSETAMAELASRGFKVRSLGGGMEEWRALRGLRPARLRP